jgi:hypothetical protein
LKLTGEYVRRSAENCEMRSVVIINLHKTLLVRSNKKGFDTWDIQHAWKMSEIHKIFV